ncbi:MAG: GNAT family N-acetyltransferase [Roseibacillus sp.]
MSNESRLEIIEDPGEDLREEAVYFSLRTHNQNSSPVHWEARDRSENDPNPLNIFAFGADRSVLGGLLGTTQFSWLKVDLMATRLESRGIGVGKALLARAEEVARERGCKYAYTDTMEYQAPGFYLKAGYKITGELPDWDSHGHKKFFFLKELR